MRPKITQPLSGCWKAAESFNLAERPGFEPGNQVSPITRLAGERLQPARPSLLDLMNQNTFSGCLSAFCETVVSLINRLFRCFSGDFT